jgi:hypothetical protein
MTMTANVEDDKTMIRYLLGELSDEDQCAVEQRFFCDEEYHERLRQVETDLIDRYGRGELDSPERALFERCFLISPERRQRARLARALAVVTDEHHAAAPRPVEQKTTVGLRWEGFTAWLGGRGAAWQLGWASLTVLLLIGGIWFWTDARRLRGQADKMAASERDVERLRDQLAVERDNGEDLSLQLERERRERAASQQSAEQLREELSRLERERAANAVPALSFLLSPGIARGDEPARLTVPDRARLIRLELELLDGTERPEYRVEVRTAGGILIWSHHKRGVRTSRGAVDVRLPADTLSPGEYEITLRGVPAPGQIEDLGYYYFKVVRR